VLGLSVKLYLKILDLTVMSDLKVIFIILIIILNLPDLNLSEFSWNTRLNSLGCESGCKVVS
jgi:hypothetical protein